MSQAPPPGSVKSSSDVAGNVVVGGENLVVHDNLGRVGTEKRAESVSPPPQPVQENVTGVSGWDSNLTIDWGQVREAGNRFAFDWATDGVSATNLAFAKDWATARQAGLTVGACHIFRFAQDGRGQAELFLQAVQLAPGDLPAVLALDGLGEAVPPLLNFNTPNQSESPEAAASSTVPASGPPPGFEGVQEWLDVVEAATGRAPILRINLFIGNTVTLPNSPVADWLKQHALWLNDFNPLSPTPDAELPWRFWRTTTQTSVAGIPGPVDVIQFSGTESDLQAFGLVQTPEVGGAALNDQPGGRDQLGYDDYARALARMLSNPNTKTPLTVGIYGSWGTGKSFLMRLVKEQTCRLVQQEQAHSRPRRLARLGRWVRRQPPEGIDIEDVVFNAWVYSGSENLWAGMITQLYDSVEKQLGPLNTAYYRLNRTARSSLRRIIGLLAVYGLLGFGLSLLLDFNTIGQALTSLQAPVSGLIRGAAGAGLVGGALAALPPLINALRDLANAVTLTRSRQLASLASRPDFRDKIGFMADIKQELGEISKMLNEGIGGRRRRMMMIIDDLDRCPPSKAVEVLEAIMLLLADDDGSPFIVLLGIDPRVIVKAIEDRYGKVLADAGISGYDYLDKLVQIPFRIPPAGPDQLDRYVKSLFYAAAPPTVAAGSALPSTQAARPAASAEAQAATATVPAGTAATAQAASGPVQPEPAPLPETPFTREEEETFELFAKNEWVGANPRRVKRIVNVYRVARMLSHRPAASAGPKLIKWIILTERWPYRATWMLQRVEQDQQTGGECGRAATTLQAVYASSCGASQ